MLHASMMSVRNNLESEAAMKERLFHKILPLCAAFLFIGLTQSPTPLRAADVVLVCPDLARAEQLGNCPTQAEFLATYRETCPEFMEKRGECKPFAAFARSKNKALWAAQSENEEFLAYMSCAHTPDIVKTSKAVSVEAKCDAQSGRCDALCGYENDITFNLRVNGICRTEGHQKIDCGNDPKGCVVTCDLFED